MLKNNEQLRIKHLERFAINIINENNELRKVIAKFSENTDKICEANNYISA